MTSPARGGPDTAGMRSAPDPRFRDQIAEALVRLWGYEPDDVDPAVAAYDATDALLPLIATEVEARVQAAANQRAAEVEALAVEFDRMPRLVGSYAAERLRAALTPPAPTEEKS